MANTGTPTFKLVLVGDGGTGKVRRTIIWSLRHTEPASSNNARSRPAPDYYLAIQTRSCRALYAQLQRLLTPCVILIDYIREASLDGRV
jgi:GTPase SAR1 family protein